MLHRLRRHPIPVSAFFEHCLVLTYAFPEQALRSFLPAGMTLDTVDGLAFLAAAFVQTRGLRPTFMPRACGQDFFLAGYRLFVKHRTAAGRTLRGLRILRSDADRRAMVVGGNLLTHYNYRLCKSDVHATAESLSIRVRTPHARADVSLVAHLKSTRPALPAGSPFSDERAARRFCGPMPYTFDYEPETNSIVRIRGVHEAWSPRLVPVDVHTLDFVETGMLAEKGVRLASAFHVANIPYRWERGVVEPLGREAA